MLRVAQHDESATGSAVDDDQEIRVRRLSGSYREIGRQKGEMIRGSLRPPAATPEQVEFALPCQTEHQLIPVETSNQDEQYGLP